MSLEGLIIGNYKLIKPLGPGHNVSDVYLAVNTHISHKLAAIKFIRATRVTVPENMPTIAGSSSSYVRETMYLSKHEANAIAQLEHRYILSLFDYGETLIEGVNTPYLVMEYRPEGTLADWIKQNSVTKTLTPPEMVHFLKQAAEALQYAHDRNIIHQDVKPANFLIRPHKGADLPDILLADFGIAKFVNPDPNSTSPYIITNPNKSVAAIPHGTPYYMPPEQWEGKPVFATDQYALAVMTYQLITGRLPFEGSLADLMSIHATAMPKPLSAINPGIPRSVDAVILKALQKQPGLRYPNVTAFANSFVAAANDAVQPPKKRKSISFSQQQTAGQPPLPCPPFSPRNIALMLIAFVLICILGAGIPIFAAAQNAAQSETHATATTISAKKTAIIVSLNATHTAATAIVRQHATATAAAYLTATADTHATATAIIGATATAYAIANHYDPYPPELGPDTIFSSLFAPPSDKSWNISSDTSGECQFANASYEDTARHSGGSHICTDQRMNFYNFTFQIDMIITQGDCGGIVFNYQRPTLYYRLRLCQGGAYDVARIDDSGTHFLTSGTTRFLLGQNQLNRIALIDDQGTISVYVRGQVVAPNIQDTFFSATQPTSGLPGVIASSNPNTPTTVVDYRNELVWKM